MSETTIQSVAQALNGIEYRAPIPAALKAAAKAAGIVIVFGASDNLMEFEGAICDEIGAYEGATAYVDGKGLLDRSQCNTDEEIAEYVTRKAGARTIEALWCAEPRISWTYKTEIPHTTFEIKEDGVVYCRGIVFQL